MDIKNLRVVNSNFALNFGRRLNLEELRGKHVPPPKRRRRQRRSECFRQVIWQYKDHPSIRFLIYSSGKAVMLGCKTLQEINDCIAWIAVEIPPEGELTQRLCLVVFHAQAQTRLNLTELYPKIQAARANTFHGYYEQERNSSIVYAPRCQPDVRCLLFASGSIIITGLQCLSHVLSVIEELHLILSM